MHWIICLFILFSCQETPKASTNLQTIVGRDGTLIYRAKVPKEWIRIDSSLERLSDTTVPLIEFAIDQIRITIHNFPSEKQIPPQAQVERWKKQFVHLKATDYMIKNESHGGFFGLFFDATDQIVRMLAWAMQIAPLHYQKLDQQARSDYTIKAVGPPEEIEEHYHEIVTFANSFELINEIPHDF